MSTVDPFELVGTTVADRYAVEEVVGEGGFAVVYRAMHLVWKRPVAIKAFKGNTSLPPRERERLLESFFKEGALLAELSERSTAVCQARDTSTLETSTGEWVPYMVLEWLDGETLEAVLGRERTDRVAPRSIAASMALLEPIVDALDHAHRRSIAHRDLKPANLFVIGDARRDDCIVKILDFGIAKVLEDARKSLDGSTNETSMFTPHYGAPEQFSRTFGPTGPWTDVFAIALVLVELITGKAPLRGETVAQLARNATLRRRRPTPRTHGVLITDAVEEVFATALAVEPHDRYLSAGDFWTALRAALGTAPKVARPEIAAAPLAALPAREEAPQLLATRLSFPPPEKAKPPPRRPRVRPEARRRIAMGVALLSLGGLLGVSAPHLLPLVAHSVTNGVVATAATFARAATSSR